MSMITLHKNVDVPAIHSFDGLAQEALQLLKQSSHYDSATFQCDGVTVPVHRGSSLEEVRSDFISARFRGPLGGVRSH